MHMHAAKQQPSPHPNTQRDVGIRIGRDEGGQDPSIIYIHICTYVWICIYIYLDMYTCIHIHMYKQSNDLSKLAKFAKMKA